MGSFLYKKMWWEAVRESADILYLKLDCVVRGFMNLCNLFSVVWFLVVRKPLVETSKQSTEKVYSVMSEVKWAYLLLFFCMSVDLIAQPIVEIFFHREECNTYCFVYLFPRPYN